MGEGGWARRATGGTTLRERGPQGGGARVEAVKVLKHGEQLEHAWAVLLVLGDGTIKKIEVPQVG